MILQMRYLVAVLFAILALGLPACGTMSEGNQEYAMGPAVADSDLSGFGKIAEAFLEQLRGDHLARVVST